MNEMENDRLRQAVERLMSGQQEALEVVRQALEGASHGSPEDTLWDLQDILQGASEDTRAILEIEDEEGEPGAPTQGTASS